MPGKILILDSVPTNRIVLKVKLSSAFYQVVQAGTLKEALALIRRSPPDLVVIGSGQCREDALNACKTLKASAFGADVPVLLLNEHPVREFFLDALRAGADHVFAKPVDEAALLARIRSLLRARDTQDDLRLRDRTSRALGFAEVAQSDFDGRASILFATPDSATGLCWRNKLKPLVPYAMTHKPLRDALQGLGRISAPDGFVVALDASAPDEGLRLLAEIRSRTATRDAGVLVVMPTGCEAVQVDALDLGANDVMVGGFDPEEMALRLATIIKRKRLRDRLRRNVKEGLEAAITDPLTGLFNRRYAIPHLKRIAEFSGRSKRDYAVMIADLDHFKSINDRFGHAAGDVVLSTIAQRLRTTLRPVDLLARIGGEEFLIALPATGREKASDIAVNLCEVVGSHPVAITNKDLQIPVTISIGVAMASDHIESKEDFGTSLLEHADRALYGAKATGRNQVTLESPQDHTLRQAMPGQ